MDLENTKAFIEEELKSLKLRDIEGADVSYVLGKLDMLNNLWSVVSEGEEFPYNHVETGFYSIEDSYRKESENNPICSAKQLSVGHLLTMTEYNRMYRIYKGHQEANELTKFVNGMRSFGTEILNKKKELKSVKVYVGFIDEKEEAIAKSIYINDWYFRNNTSEDED